MYGLRLFNLVGPINKMGQSQFTEIYSSFFGAKLGSGFIRGNKGLGPQWWHIIEEGETNVEIDKKINSKLQKLGLFLRICNDIHVSLDTNTEFFHTKEEIFGENYFHFEEFFQDVDKKSFNRFYEESISQKEKIFLDSLNKFPSHIESFAEIIEFYEYIKGEKTKYRCIRDVLSHFATSVAIKDVKKEFPNEFEFENNELLRDSTKNQMALKKYLDEILLELKPLFINKINQDF